MERAVNIAAAIYFLAKLNTPFINTQAYKLGIIDANGKRTKKPINTPQETAAWSYYDIMVNNLKRLIALIPGGNSKLARIAASFLLMREEKIEEEDLERLFTEEFDRLVQLKEDGEPVNVVGNVAGLTGEPPVTKKQQSKYKRSNQTGERKISSELAGLMLTSLQRRKPQNA
jgi:hypothetical protein